MLVIDAVEGVMLMT